MQLMWTYIYAILCVVGLAIGQILFKVSATAISAGGSLFSARALLALLGALGIYGITSLAWVWILQRMDLGRVYPLMALAFVFVPLGSHLVFGERFQPQYFLGVILIIAGIIIAMKA